MNFNEVAGNLLVMLAIVIKKETRSARNVFIFTLALSDLLFALTIPFTVVDAVTRSWVLPVSLDLCRSLITI